MNIAKIFMLEFIAVISLLAYFLFTHNAVLVMNSKYSCFSNTSNIVNVSNLPISKGLSIQQNFIFDENGNYIWKQYTYLPYEKRFDIETWENGKMISYQIIYYNLNSNLIVLKSNIVNNTLYVFFNQKEFSMNIPKNAIEMNTFMNGNNTFGYYAGNMIEIDTNNETFANYLMRTNFYCNWQ